MWMMPLHLHVNQKSDYDDDIDRQSSPITRPDFAKARQVKKMTYIVCDLDLKVTSRGWDCVD